MRWLLVHFCAAFLCPAKRPKRRRNGDMAIMHSVNTHPICDSTLKPRSVTEIAQKSPFLPLNRTPILSGFRTDS